MYQDKKNLLRKRILSERDSLSDELRESLSRRVVRNLFTVPEFARAKKIFFYVNFRSEVDTVEALKRCLSEKKRVAVPYCVLDERRLRFVEISDLEKDLVEDSYAILEPRMSARRKSELPLSEAEVVLFPGSVFDVRGGRMGYGAGYYDNTFRGSKSRACFIGLAFDFQVLREGEFVPMADHDVFVHKIVSEKNVYDCRR